MVSSHFWIPASTANFSSQSPTSSGFASDFGVGSRQSRSQVAKRAQFKEATLRSCGWANDDAWKFSCRWTRLRHVKWPNLLLIDFATGTIEIEG